MYTHKNPTYFRVIIRFNKTEYNGKNMLSFKPGLESRSEKKLDRDPHSDRDPVRDRIDPNRKKIVFGWFQGIK